MREKKYNINLKSLRDILVFLLVLSLSGFMAGAQEDRSEVEEPQTEFAAIESDSMIEWEPDSIGESEPDSIGESEPDSISESQPDSISESEPDNISETPGTDDMYAQEEDQSGQTLEKEETDDLIGIAPAALIGTGSETNPFIVNNTADFISAFTADIPGSSQDVIWVRITTNTINLNTVAASVPRTGLVVPNGKDVRLTTTGTGPCNIYTAAEKRHFQVLGSGKISNANPKPLHEDEGDTDDRQSINLLGMTSPGSSEHLGGGIDIRRNGNVSTYTTGMVKGFYFIGCSDEAAENTYNSSNEEIGLESGIIGVQLYNNADMTPANSDQTYYNNAVNIIDCVFEGNHCYGKSEELYDQFTGQRTRRGGCIVGLGAGADGSKANLFVYNCKFKSNTSKPKANAGPSDGVVGSGIYVFDNNNYVELLVDECDFINNKSDSRGGGISVTGPCIVKNSKFIDNTSRNYGGGISIQNSEKGINSVSYIDNCYFENNSSETSGGAVCFTQMSTLLPGSGNNQANTAAKERKNNDFMGRITNCEFVKNTSGQIGGAVNAIMCTLQLENCSFDQNGVTAERSPNLTNGGAVAIQRFGVGGNRLAYRSYINHCTFTNNYCEGTGSKDPASSGGKGGALFLGNSNALNTYGSNDQPWNEIPVTNTIFKNNTARLGGGIYVNSSTAAVRTVKFRVDDSGDKTRFTGNSALFCGGGIYLHNATHLDIQDFDLVMSGNYAGEYGGGIYTNSLAGNPSTIKVRKSNTAQIATAQLSILGGDLPANVSRNAEYGGGIYTAGPSVQLEASYQGKILIEKNIAANGGGIAVESRELILNNLVTASAYQGSITITGNEAEDHGGGIYLTENQMLSFTGGGETRVTSNTVTKSSSASEDGGGGIYLTQGSSVEVGADTGTTPTPGNLRIEDNTAEKSSGGGVYMMSTSRFRAATGSTLYVQNNTAERDGGGFYVARDGDGASDNDARDELRLLGTAAFGGNKAWKVFDYPLDGEPLMTDYLKRVMTGTYYSNSGGRIGNGITSKTICPIRTGNPQCNSLYNNLDISIYIPDITLDVVKQYVDSNAEQYVDTDGKDITFELYIRNQNGTLTSLVMSGSKKAGEEVKMELYPGLDEPEKQGLPYSDYRLVEKSGGYYTLKNITFTSDAPDDKKPEASVDSIAEVSDGYNVDFSIKYKAGAVPQTETVKVTAAVENDYKKNTDTDALAVKKMLEGNQELTAEDIFIVTLTPSYKDIDGSFKPVADPGKFGDIGNIVLNKDTSPAAIPAASGANTAGLAYGVWYLVEESSMPTGYEPVDITTDGHKETADSKLYVMIKPGESHKELVVTNRRLQPEEEFVTLYIRQIAEFKDPNLITDPNEEKIGVLYVPNPGYVRIENRQEATVNPTVSYNLVVAGGADYDLPAYKEIVLKWERGTDCYEIKPVIPMNYELNRIVSADNINMNNSGGGSIIVSENKKEWYIDIYLRPSVKGWEPPYSVNRKTNAFGKKAP